MVQTSSHCILFYHGHKSASSVIIVRVHNKIYHNVIIVAILSSVLSTFLVVKTHFHRLCNNNITDVCTGSAGADLGFLVWWGCRYNCARSARKIL